MKKKIKRVKKETTKVVDVVDKRELLISLLKEKTPKLFDREPQGYSSEAMAQLADKIICLLNE